MIYSTGWLYEGSFLNGREDGFGRWIWGYDGSCDIGWCKKGSLHGYVIELDGKCNLKREGLYDMSLYAGSIDKKATATSYDKESEMFA